MPTVTQSDDPTNSASSSIIEMDEFLPIVKFKNPSSYPEEYGTLIQSDEQVELSEYLDDDKRSYNILSLTTDMKELRLTFTIAQGGSASEDDDGFLEVSLSPEDQSVKLVSAAQMEVKYGDEINVDLEWDGNANKEFYIDFHANDDEDDFNVGEYENVHCGRFKIIKQETCICQADDWTFFSSLVSEAEKVLYGSNLSWTETPECYHYALQQLRNLGYWVETERWNKKWDGTKELNDGIFQLHLDSDVAGMKRGPQKEMFKNSLAYLRQAMKTKTPVMVGLDYHPGYANDDLITDHFAVITGCGKDNGKLYFNVTDNAFNSQKYFCNCDNYEIKSADGQIIISQVRKSKKI